MTGLVLNPFAGAGGWEMGLRLLGYDGPVVGLELDADACATRAAAGHLTIRADVASYPVERITGKVVGLIASPPCQDFSTAGLRAGVTGLTGRLVFEVLRWVDAVRPEWVACEQVRGVLPIWRMFAGTLREWGYRAWSGVLNTADYGVPQTRHRAILLASRSPLRLPEPTHAQIPTGPGMFGELPRAAWVTMQDAVGWGFDTPARTVCGDRVPRWVYAQADSSRTGRVLAVDRRTNSKDGRGGMRPTAVVPVTRPAPTVTGGAVGQWVLRGDGEDRTLTPAEAGVLQGFSADYPWQGNRSAQSQQIADAVPPPFAAGVLAPFLPSGNA